MLREEPQQAANLDFPAGTGFTGMQNAGWGETMAAIGDSPGKQWPSAVVSRQSHTTLNAPVQSERHNSAVRKLRSIRKVAPLAAAALGLLALAVAADAQPEQPSEPPATSQSAEPISRIIATAIPNANFVATASRMATAHAQNSKLREFARNLARNQTSVARSLTARVNVIGPIIARRPPSAGGGAGGANVSAPQLLPDQASTLRQLSRLRGPGFDALYVSSVKESLAQLQTLYRDVAKADGDAELRSLAQRELPKLEETISALDTM
jgi:predicted outer membrane protein